jgi:hypothetical protein
MGCIYNANPLRRMYADAHSSACVNKFFGANGTLGRGDHL